MKEPDFGKLFAGDVLTPNTAALLHCEAETYWDLMGRDLNRFKSLQKDYDYPLLTASMPKKWWKQAVQCFRYLADDLEAGKWPRPTCLGEEMALYLILDGAEACVQDIPHWRKKSKRPYPALKQDFKWDDVDDLLFEDHDILMLFNMSLDDIKDSDAETYQRMGFGQFASESMVYPLSGRGCESCMIDEYTGRQQRQYRLSNIITDQSPDFIFLEYDQESDWEGDTSGGFGVPKSELTLILKPGDWVEVDTIQYSRIVGVRKLPDGDWLFRHTDEEIETQRQEFREKMDADHEALLEANRADWQRREDALPEWLKSRLKRFHDAAGHKFERDGWGYELIICELAVLFEKYGLEAVSGPYDEMPAEVIAYDKNEGCSGNQHDCARALVKHKEESERIPAGLSPLTGSADYS